MPKLVEKSMAVASVLTVNSTDYVVKIIFSLSLSCMFHCEICVLDVMYVTMTLNNISILCQVSLCSRCFCFVFALLR